MTTGKFQLGTSLTQHNQLKHCAKRLNWLGEFGVPGFSTLQQE